MSRVTVSGSPRRWSRRSGVSRAAAHPTTGSGTDAVGSYKYRSPLPRTHTARSPSDSNRRRVGTGIGPAAMSPVSTIRSTPACSTSASTASSAGKWP
jgi:hypothetical protein